jgi:hypothetical protein
MYTYVFSSVSLPAQGMAYSSWYVIDGFVFLHGFIKPEDSLTTLRQITIAYVVEALCYKMEGRGFKSQCSRWIFNWSNLSSRTMAMVLAQRLREIIIRNIPGGKKRPASKADNLTATCEPIF